VLYNYVSLIISLWAGHVACMGDMRSAYKIIVEKPGGKR